MIDPLAAIAGGIGLGMSVYGSNQARKARKGIAAEERLKGELTIQQNNLEATRAIRNSIRLSQAQRALGINAGANSGADLGSSSIQGGANQATQQGVLQSNVVDQNSDFANALQESNIRIGALGQRALDGQAIAGVGNTILGSAGQIGRVVPTLASSWKTTTFNEQGVSI